jgi:hypothetical protein
MGPQVSTAMTSGGWTGGRILRVAEVVDLIGKVGAATLLVWRRNRLITQQRRSTADQDKSDGAGGSEHRGALGRIRK